MFDDDVDGVDLGVRGVVHEEEGGEEAKAGQEGQHGHGVRRQGVEPGEDRVHLGEEEVWGQQPLLQFQS